VTIAFIYGEATFGLITLERIFNIGCRNLCFSALTVPSLHQTLRQRRCARDARLVGVFKTEHVSLYQDALELMACPKFTVVSGEDEESH